MERRKFGLLSDGHVASLYTLGNANGMQVVFSDLGGIITNILLPGNGAMVDVVLGHRDFSNYLGDTMYMGAIVGRNSNRIANAELRLGSESFMLERNSGQHNIHGGSRGLSNRLFRVVADGQSARLETTIPHLEDGFPGDLDVCVTYTLTDDNALIIDYRAQSNRPTVINLTNHSYFNLCGHAGDEVGGQLLTLQAGYYAPSDRDCIPTGELRSVSGSPFDFRQGAALQQALDSSHAQIALFGGLDHSFMLGGDGYRQVASLYEPKSGRLMEISTTLPSAQIYTANSIPPQVVGKDGYKYAAHQGFCFETQTVPNALNMPWLRSPIYGAGKVYRERTGFRFSW